MATLLFGTAVGNGMVGIPLDERGVFSGTLTDQLQPYPLTVGLLSVAMFAMHGALYLNLRLAPSPLHERVGRWIWHTWGVFLVMYVLTTIFTLVSVPRAAANFQAAPWALGVVLINVLAVANIPRCVLTGRPGQAFLSSGLTIVALVTLFSVALWPNLVTASNNPENSLTIYRAASSESTLKLMFIIALVGIPLVLTYTAIVYWTFRRRVEVGGK